MNKVFLSGRITAIDSLLSENNEVPHLVLYLSVRHRTRAGELREETYRVSAWNQAARWGSRNLIRGLPIALQGYLAQRQGKLGDAYGVFTEIAAEEFLPLQPYRAEIPASNALVCEADTADRPNPA